MKDQFIQHSNDKKIIVYAGLHPETLLLLQKEKSFRVVAVSFIKAFLLQRTLNPVNLIYKLLYHLRNKNTCRVFEVFLLKLWATLNPFSTSVFFKYRKYIEVISKNRIQIIDFENKKLVSQFIKLNNVDLLLVNSWGLLADEVIGTPKFKTVNIHASKLPQYRGALPTLWSLKNHDTDSAVSYILLDSSMDGGPIIGRHNFRILDSDDSLTIESKITKIIEDTLVIDLKGYLNGTIQPVTQDLRNKSLTGKYDEYKLINWNQEDGRDIYNKINLYPYIEPGAYCYTYFHGKKLIIKHSNFVENKLPVQNSKLGQFSVNGINLFIQTKNGVIAIKLFWDLYPWDSFRLLLIRRGIMDDKPN